MAVKCSHNNFGFCKFGENCRFDHPTQVCRKTSCQTRSCGKRHPKPCNNHFLKKHCRFGHGCKYDHVYDCEMCDNLVYLVEKEVKQGEESSKMKDELIAKMTKEIQDLKKDKDSLEKKVNASDTKNKKLLAEMKKSGEINNKLEVDSKVLKAKNKDLEEAAIESKQKIQDANETSQQYQKLKEIKLVNKKILTENYSLKAELKKVESFDREKLDEYEEKIKMKDNEIESLVLTRKVSLEYVGKLQKINQDLEQRMKDLKSKETKLPFPCDRCDSTFQTAGKLIRHVKSEHENLPVLRP